MLSIPAVVIGVVGFVLSHASASDEQKQAERDAKEILDAANGWKKENGSLGCPTISQLIQDRRLDRTARADDPWGGRYRISCGEDELRVQSPGVDRKLNTTDDVNITLANGTQESPS